MRIPNRIGSCDQTPFLKMTVDIKIDMSVTSATAQYPPKSEGVDPLKPEACCIADPASDNPMIIAIGPVTTGGKTFSILFAPNLSIMNPAAMETQPDMMIPNWACPIKASEAGTPNSAPVIQTIAAMYEKLGP